MKKQSRDSRKKNSSSPKAASGLIRLNKFISMSGVASRRRADELIWQGHVRVNGKTIKELGTQVHPTKDTVVVNNKPIKALDEKIYVIFNKPTNVLTSMNEPDGRPSIRDYFTKVRIRLFPVGRLDWHAEGLVILTNDGEYAQKITGRDSEVAKTYLVKLSGQPSDAQLKKLVDGVSIVGGKVHALAVKRMPAQGSDKYDWLKVIIKEKSNSQLRAVFAKIGFDIKKMQRIAVGSLKLANLERGHFKILSPDDAQKVFILPKEIREDKEKS